MNTMTLKETYELLGLEMRESKTLKSMTKEEILNMTPEQAKKICEEIGNGWTRSNDCKELDLDFEHVVNDGETIVLEF